MSGFKFEEGYYINEEFGTILLTRYIEKNTSMYIAPDTNCDVYDIYIGNNWHVADEGELNKLQIRLATDKEIARAKLEL